MIQNESSFLRNEKLLSTHTNEEDQVDGVVQVAPQGVSFRKNPSIIDESAKVNELEHELANLRGNFPHLLFHEH